MSKIGTFFPKVYNYDQYEAKKVERQIVSYSFPHFKNYIYIEPKIYTRAIF